MSDGPAVLEPVRIPADPGALEGLLRRAAQEPRGEALLLAGVPLRLFGFDALAQVRAPTAVVQADQDEHGPLPEVREPLQALPPEHHLEVLEAAPPSRASPRCTSPFT